jgi:hypothetical protein
MGLYRFIQQALFVHPARITAHSALYLAPHLRLRHIFAEW